MMTKKKIICALKKIMSSSKTAKEVKAYLTKEDLEEFSAFLNANPTFKQLKKDYRKVQDELLKEFKLSSDHSSSLINYALHID